MDPRCPICQNIHYHHRSAVEQSRGKSRTYRAKRVKVVFGNHWDHRKFEYLKTK